MAITAGVIYRTKFVKPKSPQAFAEYLEYQSRESAADNKAAEQISIKAYKEELPLIEELKNYKEMATDNYTGYLDYMDNPNKYANLFTATKDRLTENEKTQLKEQYVTGQQNGSIMWQNVISFDQQWLKDVGIIKNDILDEKRLIEATRVSTQKLLEKERLTASAVWCASIHHNTDNYHIHISITEPIPNREKKVINDKEEIKGYMSKKNIKAAKSAVVNTIINQSEKNHEINIIMREQIINSAKSQSLLANRAISQKYKNVYKNLPENTQLWFYNKNAISEYRPLIDDITKEYIRTYHAEEFNDLLGKLQEQEELYKTAYGESKNNFKENKINDLYARMGNAILKEMRSDKKIEKEGLQNQKSITPAMRRSGRFTKGLNNIRRLSRALDNEYKKAQAQTEYEIMVERTTKGQFTQ